MNGLIPLGIPESTMLQFFTLGLGVSTAPPPDPIEVKGSLLSIDTPKTILSDVGNDSISSSFALPLGSTRITYQVSGTVSDVDLLGSLDGTHFSVLDNQSSAGIFTIQTNVTFIAARVNTGSGVSVIVIPKREKL